MIVFSYPAWRAAIPRPARFRMIQPRKSISRLTACKLSLRRQAWNLANMVFVNPYLTADIPSRVMNEHYARRFEFGNTPARATIEVTSLPGGAHIEYTGVAVRDLAQRKAVRPKNMPPSPTASPCVFAGDTLYCSAKEWISFPGRMAASTPPPPHTRFGKPCAIFSTTSKRLA